MSKKLISIRVAAGAVILFGMAACGHKAEAEKAVDTMVADTLTAQVNVQEDSATEVTEQMAETVVEEAVESVAPGQTPGPDGYITTTSGLKYKVLRKGDGRSPKATDIVKVNYEGKLLNGTIFDSSYQRGEPIEFPLNRVIPGWTEGLQLMQEGAEYEFLIPSNLAYGPQGAGPIPPNSDLIFTVELLQVNP